MKKQTLLRTVILAAAGLALSSFAFGADVKENWTSKCARCHAADGSGKTAVGKKLKIRDYTSADVQAKMTDEEITKAILDGVTVDGKERMKPFKDALSADDVKAMLAHIRAMKK